MEGIVAEGLQVGDAKRRNRRGRAIGGMVMGIKKALVEKERRIEVEEEGMIVGDIRWGREKWRVVGIYVGDGIEEALQRIEKWDEKNENRGAGGRGF